MSPLTSQAMGLQGEAALEDLWDMLRTTCCMLRDHSDLLRAAAEAPLCTAQDTWQQQ